MYIDDIKLFAKNEKELETLIHAVRQYSQAIGMEFGIEKLAISDNENRKTPHYKRNGTTKSRQNLNVRRKANLQTLGDIGS